MTPRIIAFAFVAFAAGGMPALADDTFFAEQKPTEYLAKDRLIGSNVHNKDGKIIGHINDLIVDGDNKIIGAVISAGGVFGIGKKEVAVPLSALGIESKDDGINVVLPIVTKEALTAAPEYKRVKPPKGWLQRAVEKGQELQDTGKDAYDAAKEQAGPALEKAKQAAKDAYEQASRPRA
ncbi:MAG TPA: PRC-barrel domain-containing protein [Hyphomicrobium sp.]